MGQNETMVSTCPVTTILQYGESSTRWDDPGRRVSVKWESRSKICQVDAGWLRERFRRAAISGL